MVVGAEPQSGSLVWQTRLSREAAATYEQDLATLGLDRSEALRRGLRLLHREALEVQMARDVAEFYPGGRAPLSAVTAASYATADATGPDPGPDGPTAASPERVEGRSGA